MNKPVLSNVPSGAQFMMTLIIIFLSYLITMIVSALFGTLFFENTFLELMGLIDFRDEGNLPLIKYLQIMQSIGIFVVPPIIVAVLFGSGISKYLQLDIKPYLFVVLMIILLTIAATPFINFLAEINSRIDLPASMDSIENWMKSMEETAAELTERMLVAKSLDVFLLNLFMIAVIPAIGEELLFRGVIQKQLSKLFGNYHFGIWFAAILFSALHMQFYGFIPRLFLGVLFGYLLVWTGSIWIPVTAHFINNAAAVIFYYLYSNNRVGKEIETIGAGDSERYYVAISVVFITVILIVIFRYQKNKSNS